MKKFFTELMEYLSAVILSSFVIYSVFTKIIGTPKDIKAIESNVVTIKSNVDTVLQKQDLIIEGFNRIGTTQTDIYQRLYDNNYLIRQNTEQLEKLGRAIKDVKKTNE